MNDHQIQITENFSRKKYILPLYENDDLGKVLKEAIKYKPNKYISNTKNMIKLVSEFIDNN